MKRDLVSELKQVLGYEYRRVAIDTVENVNLVDRLIAGGWRIAHSSLFSVLLERRSEPEDGGVP